MTYFLKQMSDDAEAAINVSPDIGVPKYAAVIRAYQRTTLLEGLIQDLRQQTCPPEDILIVDSSGSEETQAAFLELGARVVPYTLEEFNYSEAINVGVDANICDYTLIISSHLKLEDKALIEAGWAETKSRGFEVCYWTYLYSDDFGDEKLIELGRSNFDGRNGLSNSMSFIPTKKLAERPFRPEVFSAEDQEWTHYYLKQFKTPLMRIETKGLRYENPNHSGNSWSLTKLLNEELAIGHFVNRRLLFPDRIAVRFCRGVLAKVRRRPDRAKLHFGHAKALFMANFVMPTNKSKYF